MIIRFFRRTRADSKGRARIGSRDIYIIPTRYGFGYGLLLFLMLLGSINYANNLGFLLTFLLAGLGLVGMLHTWRNLVDLELRPGRATPVFAGEDACFGIHMSNRRRSPRPGIRIGFKTGDTQDADLIAEDDRILHLCTGTEHRGFLPIPRITLSSTYPLGLFRAWVYVELTSSCLVYPAPGERMPASQIPEYTQSQQGDKGVGSDDFIGLRNYRPGDSPKQINWKAVGREQGLQTKLFGGDRSERRWLDWHQVEGSVERRLGKLCRGVLDANEREFEFGLRLPGQLIKPGRGQIQRNRCLRALALFKGGT